MTNPHPNRYGGIKFPDGFVYDPYEQLQDTLLFVHNGRVKKEFRDLADPDEEWIANLNTPRSRLRIACTMQDEDSGHMTMMRLWLFYVILGKAKDFQTPIYGIPVPSYQETVKFKPQVTMFFQEDGQDVEQGYPPVTGEISFRLVNENPETVTEIDLERYATRIRQNFAAAGGFVWRKGKLMASYNDKERGYKLQILARNNSEAKRVIEQVLDIQQHTPNWEYLNISENDQESSAYPTIPPTRRIYGRNRRMPRRRPIADVRFKSAHVHIWGVANPITLIDLTGFHRNALIGAQ